MERQKVILLEKHKFSAVRRNGILTYATMLQNPENTTFNQSLKNRQNVCARHTRGRRAWVDSRGGGCVQLLRGGPA
jgi:hypothetical protein